MSKLSHLLSRQTLFSWNSHYYWNKPWKSDFLWFSIFRRSWTCQRFVTATNLVSTNERNVNRIEMGTCESNWDGNMWIELRWEHVNRIDMGTCESNWDGNMWIELRWEHVNRVEMGTCESNWDGNMWIELRWEHVNRIETGTCELNWDGNMWIELRWKHVNRIEMGTCELNISKLSELFFKTDRFTWNKNDLIRDFV